MEKNKNFFLKNYKNNSSKKNSNKNEIKPSNVNLQVKYISIFLILIGIENAGKIIKNFKKIELELIKSEMAKIKSITEKDIEETEKKFGKIDKNKIQIPKNIPDYVQALFINAFGQESGYSYFIKTEVKEPDENDNEKIIINKQTGIEKLSFLKKYSADEIYSLISKESSSVISIILSLIDPKLSAEILNLFNSDLKIDIIKKISIKSELNPDILDKIIESLKDKVSKIANNDFIEIQGKSKLIEILKRSSYEQQTIILDSLKNTDPFLAQELEEKIFTFNDLIDIPKKSMVYALKKYQDQDIAFILKGADEEIKDAFFNAVSKKRKEIILDEIEYLGKVKKTDVDLKRFEFIKYLKNLENAGKIQLIKDKEIYVE